MKIRIEDAIYNRPLLDKHGVPYDIVCGTFFVAGLGAEEFTSLTDDQIQRYKKLFDSRMVATVKKERSLQRKGPRPHNPERGGER